MFHRDKEACCGQIWRRRRRRPQRGLFRRRTFLRRIFRRIRQRPERAKPPFAGTVVPFPPHHGIYSSSAILWRTASWRSTSGGGTPRLRLIRIGFCPGGGICRRDFLTSLLLRRRGSGQIHGGAGASAFQRGNRNGVLHRRTGMDQQPKRAALRHEKLLPTDRCAAVSVYRRHRERQPQPLHSGAAAVCAGVVRPSLYRRGAFPAGFLGQRYGKLSLRIHSGGPG